MLEVVPRGRSVRRADDGRGRPGVEDAYLLGVALRAVARAGRAIEAMRPALAPLGRGGRRRADAGGRVRLAGARSTAAPDGARRAAHETPDRAHHQGVPAAVARPPDAADDRHGAADADARSSATRSTSTSSTCRWWCWTRSRSYESRELVARMAASQYFDLIGSVELVRRAAQRARLGARVGRRWSSTATSARIAARGAAGARAADRQRLGLDDLDAGDVGGGRHRQQRLDAAARGAGAAGASASCPSTCACGPGTTRTCAPPTSSSRACSRSSSPSRSSASPPRRSSASASSARSSSCR